MRPMHWIPIVGLSLTVAASAADRSDQRAHGAGRLLWEDRYDRAGGTDVPAYWAVAAAGNRVFVAGGSTNSSGDLDLLVRAHDASTGTLLWSDEFDHAGGEDYAWAVTEKAGRVFVSGSVSNAAGTLVLVIRAYDSRTGALLWQDLLDPGGGLLNRFEYLATSGDTVFAVGTMRKSPGNGDWIVRAYDMSTGALVWQDQFDRAGRNDRARSVAVAGDRVVVGGISARPGDFGLFYVRAYDASNGALLWQDAAPGVFGDAVNVVADGRRAFVSGTVLSSIDPVVNQDWLVRAYDATTGRLLWEDSRDTAGGRTDRDTFDVAWNLAVAGGRLFAAGQGGHDCFWVAGPGNCDFLVRAYDVRTGAVVWDDHHDRTGMDDVAHVIATDGNRVFAGGNGGNDCAFSGLPTNCDFLIRSYDSKTGELAWEDQADKDGGDDELSGLSVHGNRVFAAGYANPAGQFSFDVLIRVYASGASGTD